MANTVQNCFTTWGALPNAELQQLPSRSCSSEVMGKPFSPCFRAARRPKGSIWRGRRSNGWMTIILL